MRRLGIVTALAPEAAIARRAAASAHEEATVLVHLAGPGADRAARAARALVAEGSEALMSLGVAGGLDPALAAGTVVLSDRLVGPDRSVLGADAEWRDRLLRAANDRMVITIGDIACTDRPLRDAGEKASLHEATGAVALDMESFAVAGVARDAGIPFLAVRAIADPAWRAVPEAAMRALGPDGRIHALKALGGLLARPAEAWDFALVARDGWAAFAALRRVALLGSGFGPGCGPGCGIV